MKIRVINRGNLHRGNSPYVKFIKTNKQNKK
nr:MAG TPA: hypothetical protein [Caudoviricetes sp.]DAX18207.1 MAG TPA: hypothetical protein [Caudoviricetes sp.]